MPPVKCGVCGKMNDDAVLELCPKCGYAVHPKPPDTAWTRDMPTTEKVAAGYNLLVGGIWLHLFAFAMHFKAHDPALVIGIVSSAIFLVGLYRLLAGLGYGFGGLLMMLLLGVIPFAKIVIWYFLNSEIKDALIRNGYRVGIFGAWKDENAEVW